MQLSHAFTLLNRSDLIICCSTVPLIPSLCSAYWAFILHDAPHNIWALVILLLFRLFISILFVIIPIWVIVNWLQARLLLSDIHFLLTLWRCPDSLSIAFSSLSGGHWNTNAFPSLTVKSACLLHCLINIKYSCGHLPFAGIVITPF